MGMNYAFTIGGHMHGASKCHSIFNSKSTCFFNLGANVVFCIANLPTVTDLCSF